MARLFNDPAAFADESAAGFARAYGAWVRRTPGGVVRRDTAAPQVALVIGGGSGHYPAFAGLVGPGLAHGAAMGNLFASPSAQQAQSVARAAQSGRGVLFSYGNYAGDVLNFDQAQAGLRAEGIPCETVVVTDDIYSAPADQPENRRGIAGDLVVFKVAGAAAAEGADLAEVTRVATKANARTRSMGVAFSGCTLPGASEPLFTVPPGRMAVGMGIHGEPGIDETDIPTAAGLAALLVDSLLPESPGGTRVVALLNGLGSIKYEELFVLYSAVAARLDTAGLTVVEPEVGELVTSFDMAGVSLTLCWLDPELERLWTSPCSTPAFRKGSVPLPANGLTVGRSERPVADGQTVAQSGLPVSGGSTVDRIGAEGTSDEDRALARFVVTALDAASRAVDAHVDELGRLDAVAGDGDHGIGMQRGVHAAAGAAERAVGNGAGAAATLRAAADAWADRAGGTSGALWGVGLTALADHLFAPGPGAAGSAPGQGAAVVALGPGATGSAPGQGAAVVALESGAAGSAPGQGAAVVALGSGAAGSARGPADGTGITGAVEPERDLVRAVDAAVAAVMAAGGAEVGDRTLVDVLVPFRDALRTKGFAGAVAIAEEAAEATARLAPRKGRARAHAARTLDTPDPGARSLALILRALTELGEPR